MEMKVHLFEAEMITCCYFINEHESSLFKRIFKNHLQSKNQSANQQNSKVPKVLKV